MQNRKNHNHSEFIIILWTLIIATIIIICMIYRDYNRYNNYNNCGCSSNSVTMTELQNSKSYYMYNLNDVVQDDIIIEDTDPYYYITDSDVECLSYIISGEAAYEPIECKMAVAQCLLNAMRQDGLSANEVRNKYQYAGWNVDLKASDPENWMQVLDAIERVFKNGETVTDENIMWFYAPKYCTSEWHETQQYVGTWGTQRFFAPND